MRARHGAARRRDPARVRARRHRRARRLRRGAGAVLGPALRARARRPAPRREAGQRADRRGRHGQGDRLRHRPGAGRDRHGHHARGLRAGHAGLHGPGAGGGHGDLARRPTSTAQARCSTSCSRGGCPSRPTARRCRCSTRACTTTRTPLREVAPDVPPELADVVMRALERDPAHRYASAEALRSDLAAAAAQVWGRGWITATPFAAGLAGAGRARRHGRPGSSAPPPPEPAQPPPPPEPPPRGRRAARRRRRRARRRWRPAGVAVALLAGSGGGDDSGARRARRRRLRSTRRAGSRCARRCSSSSRWRRRCSATRPGCSAAWWGAAPTRGRRARCSCSTPRSATGRAGPLLPVPLNHSMAVVYKGNPVVIGGLDRRRVQPHGGDLGARLRAASASAGAGSPPLNEPARGRRGGRGRRPDRRGRRAGRRRARVDATEVFDGEAAGRRGRASRRRASTSAPPPTGATCTRSAGATPTSRDVAVLERYDPAADDWATLPPMRVARDGLGAAVTAGGCSPSAASGPPACSTPSRPTTSARRRWTEMKPLPRAAPRAWPWSRRATGCSRWPARSAARHTDSTDAGDALSLNPR